MFISCPGGPGDIPRRYKVVLTTNSEVAAHTAYKPGWEGKKMREIKPFHDSDSLGLWIQIFCRK